MGNSKNYLLPLLKQFFRSKKLFYLYCVSSILGLGVLGLMLLGGGSGGAYLYILVGYIPLVSLLFFISDVIIAFEFSRQVFAGQRESLFRARRGGQAKVVVALLLALALLWLMVLVLALLMLSVFAKTSVVSDVYYLNGLSVAALSIGGSTLVALLLGLFLGKVVNRAVGYGIISVVFILLSPIAGTVLGQFFGAGAMYSLRLAIYGLLIAPFELTTQMNAAPLDSVYLIPNEMHRWILPLLWALSLLTGLIFSLRRNQKFSLLLAFVVFVSLVAPWSVYGSYIALPRLSLVSPQSFDDQTMMPDIIDTFHKVGEDLSSYNTSIPTVSEYTLDLVVGNMLNAKVNVVLDTPFKDVPQFTLFKGYRVKKVANSRGEKLDFIQEDNYLTILTSGQEHNKEFFFEYSGSGWGNYANQQGIFLPGSFPWYPWPGKQRFYWRDDRFHVVVSDYMPRRGKVEKIRVRVDSAFSEVQTPQGIVLGQSDSFVSIPAESLTLMAGDISSVGNSDTFILYGGTLSVKELFSRVATNESYTLNQKTRHEIVESAYELRRKMGFAFPEELACRTLVLVPNIPRFNNLYDIPVYGDGVILMADGIVPNFSLALVLQGIPQAYEKRNVYECLYYYFYDRSSFLGAFPGTNASPEQDSAFAAGNLFTDMIKRRGEDYTLRRVREYLCDKSQTQSGEEFLKSLGSEQNESY